MYVRCTSSGMPPHGIAIPLGTSAGMWSPLSESVVTASVKPLKRKAPVLPTSEREKMRTSGHTI